MLDLPRRQLALWLVAGVAVVLVGAWWARSGGATATPGAGGVAGRAGAAVRVSGGAGGGAGRAVVHVAGAVRRPGVYRLRAGARVQDAVRRAGGPTRRADLGGLNLAARLEDGRQVIVPVRAPAGAVAAVAGAAATAAPAVPVNLNTAAAEQLETLDGIGPTTAAKIIAYRQEHGGFGSVDELDDVPGIGPATMAALRDHVTV